LGYNNRGGAHNLAGRRAEHDLREDSPEPAASPPAIQPQAITASGLRPLAFLEYDVEYVVRDIESLVFWLNALDPAHADVDGQAALANAAILNRVLAGNVDERGFVTNEHRYLAIAQCVREQVPGRSSRPIPPAQSVNGGCRTGEYVLGIIH
jgi:hypothetical protein